MKNTFTLLIIIFITAITFRVAAQQRVSIFWDGWRTGGIVADGNGRQDLEVHTTHRNFVVAIGTTIINLAAGETLLSMDVHYRRSHTLHSDSHHRIPVSFDRNNSCVWGSKVVSYRYRDPNQTGGRFVRFLSASVNVRINIATAPERTPVTDKSVYCDSERTIITAPCSFDVKQLGNYKWYVRDGAGPWRFLRESTGNTIDVGISDLYAPASAPKYGTTRYFQVRKNRNWLSHIKITITGGGGRPPRPRVITETPVYIYDEIISQVSTSITHLPDPPVITEPIITPPSCYGGNDGQIIIDNTSNPIGRVTDYNYTLTRLPGQAVVYNLQGGGSGSAVTLDATTEDRQGQPINLTAGDWELQVAYGTGLGCVLNSILTIPDRPELQSTQVLSSHVSPDNITYNILCKDGTDDLTVNAIGGTPPYSYSMDNGTTFTSPMYGESYTFTGIPTGTYTTVVRDAFYCSPPSAQGTVTLIEPTLLEGLESSISHVQCKGGNDGALEFYVWGGVGPYTLDLAGPVPLQQTGITGTANFVNLTAGAYQLTVTDYFNCQTTLDATITEPTELFITGIQPYSPNCFGESNGSIAIQAIGGTFIGTDSYNYSIRHLTPATGYSDPLPIEQDTAHFAGLPAGLYEVKVIDGHDCFKLETIEVTQPALLNIAFTKSDVICKGDANGEVLATITGGTAPYTIIWEDDNYSEIKSETTMGQILLTALPAGTYTLQVKDSHGCTNGWSGWLEKVVEIIEPEQLVLLAEDNLIVHVSCQGGSNGSVTLHGQGGWQHVAYKYSLDGLSYTEGNNFHDQLSAGTYTYYVKDGNGCVATTEVTITEPIQLVANSAAIQMVSCKGQNDGAFSMVINGGTAPYQVSHDNGLNWSTTPQFDQLIAGDYPVKVSDANGCEVALNVTITEPNLLSIAHLATTNTLCGRAEGGAMIAVSGGTLPYSLQWYDSNEQQLGTNSTLENVAAGSYQIAVTDAHQCSTRLTVNVSNTDGPGASVENIIPVSCHGGADGGALLSVTEGGGAIESITWPDGQTGTEAKGLQAGVYEVAIKDNNGCLIYLGVTIPEPTPLAINVITQTNPQCNADCNGLMEVAAMGGVGPYTYQWSGGETTQKTENQCAGSYGITVTDANGCSYAQTIVLDEAAPVEVMLEPDVTLCGGQQLALDGAALADQTGNAATYHWQSVNGFESKESSVTLSNEDTYTLTVTDGKGCVGSGTMVLKVRNDLLEADFVMPTEAYVGDTTVIVEVSYPVPDRIDWYFEEGIANNSLSYDVQELHFETEGTYTVTLEVGLGDCRDELSKQITIYNPEDKGNVGGKLGYEEKGIKEIVVYPNPNDGVFKVSVVLEQVASTKIRVISAQGDKDITSQQKEGSDAYEFDFNLKPSQPGIYLLVVEAGGETKIIRIVVN
jgi:hypothetical protein